ncbi:MAG: hypothetical protein ACYCYM_12670 [Saccharofermentanales bacterium]
MLSGDRISKKVFGYDYSGIRPVDPKIQACVVSHQGETVLFLDGVQTEPIFFFGNTEARNYRPFVAEEIRMAAEAGIHLHTVVVHFPVVPEGTAMDFSIAADVLDYVLKADEQAKIIVRIPLYPHDEAWWQKNMHGDDFVYEDGSGSISWWHANHPDDLMVFRDGSTSMPSVASDIWFRQATAALDAGIDFITSDPLYSRHVIGYHLTYGSTGEWFYMDYRTKGCDHSECSRIGFSRWLAGKYMDVESLSAAWGRKIGQIADIRIPAIPNELPGSEDDIVFLDESSRDVLDFYDYINDLNEHRIEQLARYVKLKTQRKSLVMIFYGYNYELPDPKSGHTCLQELLECGDVDMLSSPVSYQDRSEGGVMAYMAPVDSILRHGVLWMVEDDTRTHLAADSGESDAGFNPTVAEGWATQEVHKRNFASIISHSNGMWWMDLWGSGWLLDRNIWKNNRRMADIYRSIHLAGVPFLPEVAFIIDEKCAAFMNNPSRHQHEIVYRSNIDIYRSGVSVGFYTFSDTIGGLVPDSVRLYIFLNAFHFTEDQYALLRKNVMINGNSLLFNYGIDCIGGRYSYAISGMDIVPANTPGEGSCYYVDESPDVNVFERAGQGNRIVFAARRFEDCSVIFHSGLTLDAASIRKAAAFCGVNIFIDSDDYFTAGKGMLCIHAKTAGTKTIHLPFHALVQNLYEEDCFETESTFEIRMEANRTALYAYREIV